ncbi:uncharacterized protein CLAFUR5_14056 [Fulvia fulva]|uniref:Uncharacterized protein n=1 Tax=Passalora fulva TaxID=5499 RepID=A0A9Q8UW22_PASFU|nr:uncharacterized protein CLAFUR5_14056 [Fulvia fulva]KAK4610810.1 hypothetical protein CLAFUR0_14231 [Fulvia fulva]UJO24579.1 hypothetical protein CLAFUR5_14056 [Fulvia fulva]
MGRMTRAKAAEVADKMLIDEDAVLKLPSDAIDPALHTPSKSDRPALGEIEPNSAGSARSDIELPTDLMKATRSRQGEKSGKKSNNNGVMSASASTESLLAPAPEVVADEAEVAGSPASRAASDDLMKDLPELEMSHLPVHDNRPQSPPSSAVRLNRSQLAQGESGGSFAENEVNAAQSPQPTPQQDCQASSKHSGQLTGTMPNFLQTRNTGQLDDVHDRPAANELKSGALGLDQSTYDILEAAAIEAQTPPKAGRVSFGNEDAITEMDALDEVVEMVSAEVPEVQPSPQKAKPRKSSAPIVRMSKAAQARISLAQGNEIAKTPALGKSRTSMAGLGQSKRVASASSEGPADEPSENIEAVIPHSKPRPMSLQFPTPPPPPKSTKAPTQSSFRLPGEEVAAKLKAAKEARLAREAEEQTKKVFKARPAPTTTKVPAVRQTSTSKARQSMAGGEEPKPKTFKARPAPTATKAPEVRQTSASKARMSLMSGKPATTTTAGVHKRANSVATCRPSVSGRLSTIKTSAAPAKSVSVSKRPATAMATMSKPRYSIAPWPSIASSVKPKAAVTTSERPNYLGSSTRVNGASTASKGKEVFNRTANAKSSEQQQKREKEEAAKKARAEAAERSRQLSREWAEKQKLKKVGVKADPKIKENVAPVPLTSTEDEAALIGAPSAQA